MIENTYYILAIISTIILTATATVSSIYALQKSFRHHLETIMNTHDRTLKIWLKTNLEKDYNFINAQLEQHNSRIQNLEENR
jgi:hypothetical protein